MAAPLELPGPSPLLDENLVLRAGAGTGKTHALVTLALQLLAGLRRRGAVPADQLWLLTFTDKAAVELRGRLQLRLRKLAASPAARTREAEPDLWAASDQLGVEFPGARRWAELLEARAKRCRRRPARRRWRAMLLRGSCSKTCASTAADRARGDWWARWCRCTAASPKTASMSRG
jgi:ATP-dependent exoDNAse (exonuclease V) beta subunit